MIDALEPVLRGVDAERGETRVSSMTLLPSGALATVAVRRSGNGTYLVSDEGSGAQDLRAMGHLDITSGDTRRGGAIAERLGLVFHDGVFSVREVTADQLAGAIVFVCEAAREWSSRTAEKAVQRAEAALTTRVEARIGALLPGVRIDRERELAGESSKKHRFDLVVDLPGDRKAVFEIVAPNTHALSSTYMKFVDLMQLHPGYPREVVTERLEDWSQPDMNLLAGVASHVRDMSRDWHDLPGLLN